MIIPDWQDNFSHLNTLRAPNGDYATPKYIYGYIKAFYTDSQIKDLVDHYKSENYRLNSNALVAVFHIVSEAAIVEIKS